MKASQPPKFETCLFGPSGIPLPIQASFGRNNGKDNHNHNRTCMCTGGNEEGNLNSKNDDTLHEVRATLDKINEHDNDEHDNDDNDDNDDSENVEQQEPSQHELETQRSIHESSTNIEDGAKDDAKDDADDGVVFNTSNQTHHVTPPPSPKSSAVTSISSSSSSSSTTTTTTTFTINPPPRPTKTAATINTTAPAIKISPLSSTSTSISSKNTTSPTDSTTFTTTTTPGHTINLQELRRLSSQGVPENCTHRPLAWRILLGYLPLDTTKWQQVLNRDRQLYRNLVHELFVVYTKEQNHKYPFHFEGRKLIGRGLKKDGSKGRIVDADKITSWRKHNEKIRKEENDASMVAESATTIYNNKDKIVVNRHVKTESDEQTHDDDDTNDNDHHHHQGESIEVERKPSITNASLHESITGNHNKIHNTNPILDDDNEINENDHTNNIDDQLQFRRGGGDDGDDDSFDEKEYRNEEGKVSMPYNDFDDIPYGVREQWRRSGRDPDCLMVGMGKTISGRYMNALLVTNNDTASTKSNDEERQVKISKSLEGDYDPKWRHFLENASLLDEIRKDVVRTHPDLQFYLEPKDNLGSRRYAAIERILFVWAKLNKGVSTIFVGKKTKKDSQVLLYIILNNEVFVSFCHRSVMFKE
jgi:hypothetical protein